MAAVAQQEHALEEGGGALRRLWDALCHGVVVVEADPARPGP
jgi:hypothetical protein